MMQLTAWPVLLPLIAGFIILFARIGGLRVQRALNLLTVLGLIFISLEMLRVSLTGVHQVYLLGNWIAPFGIVLVLDQLSALMVLITSLLALGALWYAIAAKFDRQGSHFHVLFQIQLFGLNGAFMTGDVFNLFVFFEVLLLASYGLLLHGGGRLRTRAGLQYVVINLIGSTLFLFAVGALYGAVGTLNIADMAAKVAMAPEERHGLIAAAGLLLLVVFGLKAAMFPLYLWLPSAYSQTSAPVAALFAIMTKVGLYAIIRVHGTVFGESAGDLAYIHTPWVLGLGLITLAMAALGVMAARNLREQIAYLVLASVATLLIGVGLNSPQALSATLYYLIHSTLIAGGLFLLADVIARGRGVHEDRFESAPIMPNAVLIGSFFLFAAIAMTGMPPLSGFFGKVLILASALNQAWWWLILAVILTASLLMIIAMARAGSLLFYRTQPTEVLPGEPLNKTAFIAVVGLLMVAPLMVIFSNPLTTVTDQIALQQFDATTYIEAVLNTEATEKQP
jgi:multicomponent K+:H+ antiporter subunit D